jgi:hypothetical protein
LVATVAATHENDGNIGVALPKSGDQVNAAHGAFQSNVTENQRHLSRDLRPKSQSLLRRFNVPNLVTSVFKHPPHDPSNHGVIIHKQDPQYPYVSPLSRHEGTNLSHSDALYKQHEGWQTELNPLFVADVKGDGMADLIGISDGIFVAISKGDGTLWPRTITPILFGNIAQGWSSAVHPRLAADVTGDGRAEIVGFANDGTFVSQPAP